MSTQDQITEILNAMDRNPELAEQLRARILGDDLMAEMDEAQNERVQMAGLLGTVVDLSGSLARFIFAVDSRQRKSDEAIAGLQDEQEVVQSAIANMQADIERMAASQSRMDEAIGQLQTDVETLKSDVTTLKSDVSTVKSDMVYVKGRLDNAAGANYEFKVQKNLGSIAGQHLRLRRIRTLKGPRAEDDQDLRSRVDEAEDKGTIAESENHDMWLLDLIFSGRRRDDGEEVLVAAEISITAGDEDIARAKARAETLSKATDTDTIPVVFAENIDQERRQVAEQEGVVIIPVPES